MGLAPDVASALLREALKPEMLRTSHAFGPLAAETGVRRSCPLCGGGPCAATEAGAACCSGCGLVHPWDSTACGSCGQSHWRVHEIGAIVRHARLMRCAACGETVKVFRASPDPLLLSLLGIMAAPFDLATHAAADAGPKARPRFPVF
jgi:hypothetical protein